MKVVGLLLNDWQLSGILTAGSGARYDITYSHQNGGSSVNLTGSPSYPAMIRIVDDTGKGCSDNQHGQFNVAAFAGPQTGSLGLESGRNYMAGCPDTRSTCRSPGTSGWAGRGSFSSASTRSTR